MSGSSKTKGQGTEHLTPYAHHPVTDNSFIIIITTDGAQRAQTSARAKISTKSDPGFESIYPN